MSIYLYIHIKIQEFFYCFLIKNNEVIKNRKKKNMNSIQFKSII